MEQLISIDEFIDLIRRRIKIILLVTLLGALAAVYVAMQQTHLYRSSEVIQVKRPTVDDELAPSTVDRASARRLQLIQQQLMTRGNLMDVAEKYNLFSGMEGLPQTEKVAIIREAVEINGVAAAREGFADDGTVSVITITATFDTPQKAQQVAHEFASRTIEISANQRLEQARETLSFFSSEEDKLLSELETLEDDLTAYRRDNNLAISGSLEFRQTQIASVSSEILEIEREIITLRQELSQLDQNQRATTLARQTREIEAQIQAFENQKVLLEARAEELSRTIERSPRVERELGVFERRRQNLRDQLAVVSARRAEAEVGFKLEQQRQSERLTVIEPAALPEYPVTSSRKKLVIMGTFGSALLGLALAFVMDLRHPVIRSSQQMKRRVGLTPVVTIPVMDIKPIKEPKDNWRKRIKRGFAQYRQRARKRPKDQDRQGKA
ncbi:Wzz/FepE/Etk N-terminal domain-containing protein [Roseovarius sp. MMSF_3281]|uniref:GumC family protein n=1 Tax=Roseovarius sp. MMSF_3281 TaxID=3046694 RepID=UPI00273DE61D|nr:Wzz/FepE/Etk N-terminal domain-containing protein [Roseovarius sp. MMSF_3281]